MAVRDNPHGLRFSVNLSMTIFTLAPASRTIGSGQSPRTYLDFFVSDHSLKDLLRLSDFVTPLCHQWQADQVHRSVEQLLLQSPSELRDNRVPIYVCAECGDAGCGVLSAELVREGDSIIWRDFGHENNYEEKVHRDLYAHVGPLTFGWPQYKAALISAALQWHG
jgi:hypothetical protein